MGINSFYFNHLAKQQPNQLPELTPAELYAQKNRETLEKNLKEIKAKGLGPRDKAKNALEGETPTSINLVALPDETSLLILNKLRNRIAEILPEGLEIYPVDDPHATIADFAKTTSLNEDERFALANKYVDTLCYLDGQKAFKLRVYRIILSCGGITVLFIPENEDIFGNMRKSLKNRTNCTCPEIIHTALLKFKNSFDNQESIQQIQSEIHSINADLAKDSTILEFSDLVLTDSDPYHRQSGANCTVIKNFIQDKN